ncbi:MAG: substrate-binding domain-containing protein [Candidatus Caldarchaeales archaeon]
MRLIFAVAVGLAVAAALAAFASHNADRGRVVVFAAPTLYELASEAARISGGRVDVVSIGSVAAVRQVQLGRVPDALVSVDAELVQFLPYFRRVEALGGFRLVLLCRDRIDLTDLKRVRIGLADPNTAPIGYRAVAALYWLALTRNSVDVAELERALSVRFVRSADGREVVMRLDSFRPAGNFLARDDLAGAFLLLENGAVDCVFAHSPFVVSRRLEGRYAVVEMPEELTFLRDPPVRFVAVTELGAVEVRRFEAVAVSLTEAGDSYLRVLASLDAERFGLVARDG